MPSYQVRLPDVDCPYESRGLCNLPVPARSDTGCVSCHCRMKSSKAVITSLHTAAAGEWDVLVEGLPEPVLKSICVSKSPRLESPPLNGLAQESNKAGQSQARTPQETPFLGPRADESTPPSPSKSKARKSASTKVDGMFARSLVAIVQTHMYLPGCLCVRERGERHGAMHLHRHGVFCFDVVNSVRLRRGMIVGSGNRLSVACRTTRGC